MNWRNFFYFSQGERIALTVLLSLISIAFIILMITDNLSLKANEKHETDNASILAFSSSNEQRKDSTKKVVRPKNDALYRALYRRHQASVSSLSNNWTHSEKFAQGTIVEINSADTATLKKIPGIGSFFARGIVNYRNKLGGFYSVEQLAEVFGIDEDKFVAIAPWFRVDTSLVQKLEINHLSADSLGKHPYLTFRQARTIEKLRKQKTRLSGWENLVLLDEFTEADQERLSHYLSFD